MLVLTSLNYFHLCIIQFYVTSLTSWEIEVLKTYFPPLQKLIVFYVLNVLKFHPFSWDFKEILKLVYLFMYLLPPHSVIDLLSVML